MDAPDDKKQDLLVYYKTQSITDDCTAIGAGWATCTSVKLTTKTIETLVSVLEADIRIKSRQSFVIVPVTFTSFPTVDSSAVTREHTIRLSGEYRVGGKKGNQGIKQGIKCVTFVIRTPMTIAILNWMVGEVEKTLKKDLGVTRVSFIPIQFCEIDST